MIIYGNVVMNALNLPIRFLPQSPVREGGMTSEEFFSRFQTEKDCADFLFQSKWPNGYTCPQCDHQEAYIISTRRLPLYECVSCGHQTSLLVGTVMEGSRTDLRKWFYALYRVANSPAGMTAVELSTLIKVTYKTAWLMLHKIRHIISVDDSLTLLEGSVKVNSACYGQPYNPTFYRHKKEHPVFIAASLNHLDQLTYVKIKQIHGAHLREKYILKLGKDMFLSKNTCPNAKVNFVQQLRQSHRLKPLLPLFREAARWINRAFHGIGPRHLQAYLNEFCFRVNSQLQKQDSWNRLVQLSATTSTITYTALTQ